MCILLFSAPFSAYSAATTLLFITTTCLPAHHYTLRPALSLLYGLPAATLPAHLPYLLHWSCSLLVPAGFLTACYWLPTATIPAFTHLCLPAIPFLRACLFYHLHYAVRARLRLHNAFYLLHADHRTRVSPFARFARRVVWGNEHEPFFAYACFRTYGVGSSAVSAPAGLQTLPPHAAAAFGDYSFLELLRFCCHLHCAAFGQHICARCSPFLLLPFLHLLLMPFIYSSLSWFTAACRRRCFGSPRFTHHAHAWHSHPFPVCFLHLVRTCLYGLPPALHAPARSIHLRFGSYMARNLHLRITFHTNNRTRCAAFRAAVDRSPPDISHTCELLRDNTGSAPFSIRRTCCTVNADHCNHCRAAFPAMPLPPPNLLFTPACRTLLHA